ncbi:MAG: hypothetical protein A2073_04880 [Deltaproteobacteria bacterium GWC2_42_11]|nr:MAG: hypothetical protein A2073_04880 [Deltaproteobacteria bacterium GWC2_42_11]
MKHSCRPIGTKGHENLVAACPAGKPFGWEAFRGYGFAGGAGSNSKKIFSGKVPLLIAGL